MSGSKKPTSQRVDANDEPYNDEPVPSYETALREGAGGGVAGGPSHSNPAQQHAAPSAPTPHPTYGCSPYTPHGTARIVIVPAPHFHHHHAQIHPAAHDPNQPLLPAPVVAQSSPARRAKARFFLALLQAFLIYLLINLLVDLTVTRKW